MTKRKPKKDMTNFLYMPNKLSGKKRKQINKMKQKTSLKETSWKKMIISNWKNHDKK